MRHRELILLVLNFSFSDYFWCFRLTAQVGQIFTKLLSHLIALTNTTNDCHAANTIVGRREEEMTNPWTSDKRFPFEHVVSGHFPTTFP